MKKSIKIFLLGDIFDLVVGHHNEYIQMYPTFFSELEKTLSSGIEVFFFEGNHDFTIRRVFEDFCKEKTLEGFHFFERDLLLEVDGKVTHFSHGDLVEIENESYRRYKSFITGWFMKFVCNYIFTVGIVKKIGGRASKNSRERNKKYASPKYQQEVREKFRRSFKEFKTHNPKVDVLICGHSHVKDRFEWEESLYLNNGFAPQTETYLSYVDGEYSFKGL